MPTKDHDILSHVEVLLNNCIHSHKDATVSNKVQLLCAQEAIVVPAQPTDKIVWLLQSDRVLLGEGVCDVAVGFQVCKKGLFLNFVDQASVFLCHKRLYHVM